MKGDMFALYANQQCNSWTKRKSINPECRVRLKAAEKQAQGSDILGTALVAPLCCYQQRVRETQVGFTIDEKEEGNTFFERKVFRVP